MPSDMLRKIAYASLMAALTAVGSYLVIPLSPVPLVLQNLFVLLTGLLLGSRWGAASLGIYLLVGAIGFPVFAGGKGGLAPFVGPTGGYLVSYPLCAFVVGFIAERFNRRIAADIAAVVIGSLIVYAFGVPWLKAVTGMPWTKAFLAGMLPFLPGDALKAAGAVMLARSVRPMLGRRSETASA